MSRKFAWHKCTHNAHCPLFSLSLSLVLLTFLSGMSLSQALSATSVHSKLDDRVVVSVRAPVIKLHYLCCIVSPSSPAMLHLRQISLTATMRDSEVGNGISLKWNLIFTVVVSEACLPPRRHDAPWWCSHHCVLCVWERDYCCAAQWQV